MSHGDLGNDRLWNRDFHGQPQTMEQNIHTDLMYETFQMEHISYRSSVPHLNECPPPALWRLSGAPIASSPHSPDFPSPGTGRRGYLGQDLEVPISLGRPPTSDPQGAAHPDRVQTVCGALTAGEGNCGAKTGQSGGRGVGLAGLLCTSAGN